MAKADKKTPWTPPYFPIIYVRGYAMTRGEMDQTSADPFCGFNLGSTVYRAVAERERAPRKYVFESPVVRLMSEFEYSDVYEDGQDILDPGWESSAEGQPTGNQLGSRSVVIHRYYDPASSLFGGGKTPSIEDSARRLSQLVARVRELICANPANQVTEDQFRCYLVAHSMGGLVSRAFLQNPALDPAGMKDCVDKLFTYATPHNGIDAIGNNVPSWLGAFDIDNFDRDKRMPQYLDLVSLAKQNDGRVDLLPEARFSSRKVFCMVGTNRADYDAAAGLSRTFVGNGSDGLVKIENATLQGVNADGSLGEHCAKAFAYRSHSGFYGIVNSEEAFQNLARFLFGDVRVDAWLQLDEIRLPEKVEQARADGHEIDALYQVEMLASPRGKLWYLTRRVAEEDSVACIRHATWKKEVPHYLSSIFLSNAAKVDNSDRSLSYGVTLGIRVPDYEIERKLWINQHYEGGYLFRNSIVLSMVPPLRAGSAWKVRFAWQDSGVASPTQDVAVSAEQMRQRRVDIDIPFESTRLVDGVRVATRPGVKGRLQLRISAWNA